MLTVKELKAVLYLLEILGETSTDIFWGGNPGLTNEEKALLTPEDYNKAYKDACMAYLDELDQTESNWLLEINTIMADFFGKEIGKRVMERRMEQEA